MPKHEILEEEELNLVLQKYGIDKDNLPKIKSSDAIAKAIGAKRGNVLKITRRSVTAGESTYYRLVI